MTDENARSGNDGTQAKARETVYYKMTEFASGKPGKAGASGDRGET